MVMSESLLQRIRQIRESVGTTVNDAELTALINGTDDVFEAGFRFLTFCDGWALFDVPKQDTSRWYREDGWLTEEKEQILSIITERLGLKMVEPPDCTKMDLSNTHHHFELYYRIRKVITIHPKFLKILVPDIPIIPERGLLGQLSLLYAAVD